MTILNKVISFLIFFSFALFGQGSDNQKLEDEIMNIDRAMSGLASKEGFTRSILHYAHTDIVKLNNGDFPVIGKKSFEEKYKDKPGPKTLTWEPVKAEVANSGELGYTWGNWKFVQKDTTVYGNYFTVWKKENGEWKVALDGGNSTPAPK